MRARKSSPPLSKVRMLAFSPLITPVIAASMPGRSSVKMRRRTGNVACVAAGPLDGNAALGFVQEIFDVGAILAVDGDAAAARDVADDVVTRNRIAAFRAVDHEVVVAAHDDRGVLHAEHALDGGDDLRLLFFRGVRRGLARRFREHLPRRPFAVAQVGVEIVDARTAVLGGDALPIFVGNFLQADAGVARFFFEQAAADVGGLFALVEIDPLANLAARARGVNEREPVARRLVALLRDDLDDVAVRERVAQRNHRAIHFRAHALMAHFGVHRVGEIDRSGAARQDDDAALGRECVNLFGIQVDAQRGEEFAGLLHFLHPLDELAHPDDALVVGGAGAVPALVFPVRCDALLGDAVHFLRADLNFEGLAGMNHAGVQRLIEVRPRHGDVVLETAGNWGPDLVDHAESGVAILDRVGDDADGEKIEDLVEGALLLLTLEVQRVDALHARLNFGGDSAFHHFVANRVLNFVQEAVEDFLLGAEFLLEFEEGFGLEIAEREVFELAADEAHAEAVGDGRVNIQRLAGDALLLLGIEIFERAHVVQAVGELDHHDANVVDHRQQHLADVFGLARFGSQQIEAADFRGAFHQARDVGPKCFGDLLERDFRVFDHVVEQRGAERGYVELHVRQQVGDFDRMREERLAGKARLRFVLLGGEIVGAAKEFEVVAGTVAANFVGQLDKAQVDGTARFGADGGFGRGLHGLSKSILTGKLGFGERRGLSLAFRYRVAWADPVGGEVVRENQDAKVREAHFAQRGERGTDVGAMRERAASTIDDDVRRARQRLCPVLQVVEALGSGSGSMERCVGDVRAVVQSVEAHADDLWLIRRLRIGELFCQCGSVNALGRGSREVAGRRASPIRGPRQPDEQQRRE